MSSLLGGAKYSVKIGWLYVSLLILAIIVGWQGGDALKEQQLSTLRLETHEQLQQLASLIESAIAKYQHMPTLLSANERVIGALKKKQQSDVTLLNRELEQINRITEASDSYIIDRDGNTIAASNYNLPLSFVGKNFAFRPYFQDAIQGHAGRYYALGTTSNKRGYYFSYPVYDGEQIIGVAVVKVDLGQFEKRFSNQNYEFLMLDPDSIVFSSSRSAWLYKIMGELSHQEMVRIVESQRYKDQDLITLPIVSETALEEKAKVLDILESNPAVKGDNLDRVSYLYEQRPIRLLGFQIALLAPIKTIQENVRLWRTLFAGLVVILGLIGFLAMLRKRLLRERSVAMEMSRHNQAYVNGIINNTQAGLITLDEHQCIESFNPAAERLVGHSLETLINKPFQQLFRPATRPDQPEREDESQSVQTVEGHIRHQDRFPIPVEMTLCEMRLPDQVKYLVTFHDMTERKRYEREITEARNALEQRVKERTSELEDTNKRLRDEVKQHQSTQRELIQTAKLAVMGQLSAGINHELNQPLTAIRSFADNALAFMGKGKLEQVEANLSQISTLGQHMGDIIARFKVFARKGDIQQGPVSVVAAVQAAVSIMESSMKEKDIRLCLPEVSDDLYVWGDMVYLEQVLVNLLSNAVDAISGHQTLKADREVEIQFTEEEDQVKIAVWDSGPGLNEETLRHLFEPFFTTKAQGVGLGLGLSISQRIVEAMNGKIGACNRPQGGAEFYIVLTRFVREKSSITGKAV